jgi:hypothetical protein
MGRLRDAGLAGLGTPGRRRGVSSLNRVRRRLGLAPVASAAQQLTRVDRILVTTSRAFDLWAGSLPVNVRYVGSQPQRAARLPPPLESARAKLHLSDEVERYTGTAAGTTKLLAIPVPS